MMYKAPTGFSDVERGFPVRKGVILQNALMRKVLV